MDYPVSTTTTSTPPTTFAQADLSVPAIRHAGSTILYDLLNSGGAAAAASKSSLTIDGSFIREENVAAIAGGSMRQESFNYVWSCSGASDIIRVCADSGHVVPESDETNNCNTVTWNCGGGTTTTTSSSTSTSSTIPYTKVVTLRFIVNDNHSSKLNCTLLTNISSSWTVNRTLIGVKANEINRTVLYGVPEGEYGWTVNCTDGVIPKIFPKNATRTSGGPGPYWLFYVKAP